MRFTIPLFLLALFLGFAQCNSSQKEDNTKDSSNTNMTDSSQTSGHQNGHKGHGKEDHNQANKHMHKRSFEDLVKSFESEDRAKWQKPEEVLKKLGDLKGKTVMDIGSGTGYFSFKMAAQGAKVIAADVNDKFQGYIKQRKEKEKLTDEQLVARKVPYDSPNLEAEEADHVIIVDTYHHVENRVAYFKKVLAGLKRGGQLLVVDFKKEETPHGPPLKMRLTAEEVKKELTEAGFTNLVIDTELLPYQYIVLGKK
ncbi:MAG TPA: SAM-dependent methyltransferase [Microscillaceae bacterium]|nr:SAM-dependent methyltransferase [Microscillaceae bacterium]